MSSIIEGYNYDIFISYRQKDNKHDGWVTKFVDNLKGELEATFKEDVSVYFDENPHDRLQETHNVDKSLEGKLRCLIFIPILSQTYCDHNSYAWQYEFLAFLRMAEIDRFGKDVKLRSGNVASRILPVRIHDLEPEDVKLFEKETGSVLRALDFVFKTSTGVSRPLKANEDHPNDNLNKTFYSDQINKVGHAIKEIILGMKAEPIPVVKEKEQPKEPIKEVREDESRIDLEKPAKKGSRKLLFTFAVLASLIIAGIISYPKIFKRNTLEKLRSSGERITVVVMPFQNKTNDTKWNVWQDGVQDMLITSLSNSGELKVRQAESISSMIQNGGYTDYASITPSVARTISQKLDAHVFICGSINLAGATLRINAQLIDSNSDEVFKAFQIDGTADKILPILDSLTLEVKNFLIISNLKKGVSPDDYQLIAMTNSPEAYSLFLLGNKAFRSVDYFASQKIYLQALAIDSNFIEAALKLSIAYFDEYLYDEAKKWCLMAYKKRDQMPLQLKINTNRVYAVLFETPIEEIKYLRQLQELDDLVPSYYYSSGYAYSQLFQFAKAIPEYEKSLDIYDKSGIKPAWVFNYVQLGEAYNKTGQYKKEKKLYIKAEKNFPDNYVLNYQKGLLAIVEGDTINASKYLGKAERLAKENSWTDANIASQIAFGLSDIGKKDKAEEYYRKALSLEPDESGRMNDLAYLLIDSERNIAEGIDLVDKALELKPDNYLFLHTKGWGLYKQGKYGEALDVLQKSWDLRRQNAVYDHSAFLHLEAAKKAVANQKKN
jgi:tetratricopeptide (TPR) repeat protein